MNLTAPSGVLSGNDLFENPDIISQEQISVVLKDLPPQFSIDELVDKLILVEKIEDAIEQGERGETSST